MSRKTPTWRCKNWINGVTCERPFADNTPDRKRYDIKRFATRTAYEASDLYRSRRTKIRSKKMTFSPARRAKNEHKLRLTPSARLPTSARGLLSAVPLDWKDRPNPFENPRRWADGSLPSFKKLGAIGKGNFGGVVIYSDETYKKFYR